jgi:hypothetical protein
MDHDVGSPQQRDHRGECDRPDPQMKVDVATSQRSRHAAAAGQQEFADHTQCPQPFPLGSRDHQRLVEELLSRSQPHG